MKESISCKIRKIMMITLYVALPVVLLTGTAIVKSAENYQVYGIENNANTRVEIMEKSIESEACENIEIEEAYTYVPVAHTNIVTAPIVSTTEFTMNYHNLEKAYSSIFDWMSDNKKCDFGIDQLYTLAGYCEKYEVPMELMLSIISVESGFVSTALSDYSTAAGYCQIIRGTAEGYYEDKLGYGDYDIYNHDYIMTTNWELNMELGCAIMKDNYDNNYGSWEHAIYAYHGSSDAGKNAEYFQHINTRLYELFGISVHEIR